MKKFIITGYGRKVGAIGIFYQFSIELEAESEQDAITKLYNYYEHISNIRVEEIENG